MALNTHLNDVERLRYSRQIILPSVGMEGQQKLKQARILCVGAGGLGSPILLYLAAAGVGSIGIVDDDVVELTNLQRQIIYSSAELGLKKVIAAKARLLALNPALSVIVHDEKITAENALSIIEAYDIVADGTDNFSTRYVINDACCQLQKPNVSASLYQFEGQCSVFSTINGPCYRCLYPSPPPPQLMSNCTEGGVLGVLPGLLGTLQATEIIKLILNIGEPLIGRLLTIDALSLQFREFNLKRNSSCTLCNPFSTLSHYEGMMCMKKIVEISVKELAALREQKADFLLLDVREQSEYDICNIDGKLLPMGELPERLNELDPNQLIVVHCRSGGRSRRAVEFLEGKGFKDVRNLTGGIMGWRKEIDPSLKEY